MMIPGLAFLSVAMCLRAWRAYCCPGPGSSDAIRLMAACASVKIVTRSRDVFLLEAKSNARARAAHSASNASWLCPMCVLTPTQDTPFLHTTAYPVAPSGRGVGGGSPFFCSFFCHSLCCAKHLLGIGLGGGQRGACNEPPLPRTADRKPGQKCTPP